jgi:hypothetical protein
MRNNRFIRILSLLTILLALTGCSLHPGASATVISPIASTAVAAAPSAAIATAPPEAGEIARLMESRADAVNKASQQEYLSTVLPDDAVLLKEESDLIRSASALGIQDYEASAGTPERTGTGFAAQVTQTYTLDGQKHQCTYEAQFVSENGKLYYDGPEFLVKQNSRVKVCYTQGRDEMAQQTLDAETAVLNDMKSQLGFAPQGVITVKIYGDMQVFLQSVKLDLPSWVGGWQEYGEAIKSYAGAYPADTGDLRRMLNHESTHRMVSELSNDNASYWIQEGLATVFQDALGNSGQPYLSAREASEQYTPYAQQKSIDLEKLGLEDGTAVTKYYATSKAFAAFLLDKYGWNIMRQALEYMKKYPLIPVTAAEKMQDTNVRTDDAIRTVFGFATDDDFQRAFDAWQKRQQ